LAFAYRVAKLKLFASISATDAKPRNVVRQCKKTAEQTTQRPKLKITNKEFKD